ncbi:hypothetical protein [Edaphocola flava]|uniref:hypothetical protein n=1 Tax=Edaphocola flava TaxID=2499629 RepID=UPI00100A67FC|nr:hypothetical protein [Edaphocola flava]
MNTVELLMIDLLMQSNEKIHPVEPLRLFNFPPERYHLDDVISIIQGPPEEQVKLQNYWASVGLSRYHDYSNAIFNFTIDGISKDVILFWNSKFNNSTLKEDKDIANHGGVALSWFVMAKLLDYKYVEQSEIGDGVDYCFFKNQPDDFNFLYNEYHYVEVSGILEEKKTNTLQNRIKIKHDQINRGRMNNENSSVIVTLFKTPKTIKEVHR